MVKMNRKILTTWIILVCVLLLAFFGCTEEKSREQYNGQGVLTLHQPLDPVSSTCVGSEKWMSFDYNVRDMQFMHAFKYDDKFMQYVGKRVNIVGELVSTVPACVPLLPCNQTEGCLTLEINAISEVN
jgi:hypothetical protein